MTLLIIGRGSVGFAETRAAELEAELGIPCCGRTFEMDNGTAKMKRASVTVGFTTIADSIEQEMTDNFAFRRSRVVLIIAEGDASLDFLPSALVATDQTYWLNLIALLVLAFPDIHWIFATSVAEHQLMVRAGLDLHSLPDNELARLRHIVGLRNDGFEPLYDPTGFRDLIKRQSFDKLDILNRLNGETQSPARKQLALVIDDEVEVAAAVAYIHYRQGYRALSVTTEFQLRESVHAPRFTRTAESFTVEFPDASPDHQQLLPYNRTHLLEQLAELPSDRRIIYTIDDERAERSADDQNVTVIRRPFDGLEDLSNHLGIAALPEDFVWPPANLERSYTPGKHAMPGFLTMAARCLVRRSTDAAYPAHRQALLALEAQELLLNRVPSLSLEAHRQRISAELRLESEVPTLFGGSNDPAHSRLAKRFRQLEAEINSMLAVIYNPSGERQAQLRYTFESQLIGTMIDRYRQGYHFQEELAAVARQREIDLRGQGSYLAWVLQRTQNFFLAVIGWTVVFASVYVLLAIYNGLEVTTNLVGRAALISLYTFASVGLPPSEMFGTLALSDNIGFLIVATIQCLAGLMHWGLGFAHMYALVSRR